MLSPKLKVDLVAARNVLASGIRLFYEGQRDHYRVVAGELRKLLCDQPKPLLERLFPQAHLHPSRLYRPGEDLSGLVFQVPARITSDQHGVRVSDIFERRRQPIPLREWLDMPLLNATITTRELIKSVADKEDAHADPEFNETLRLAKGVHVEEEEFLGLFMVAIGEYVLEIVDMAIDANPDEFQVRRRPVSS